MKVNHSENYLKGSSLPLCESQEDLFQQARLLREQEISASKKNPKSCSPPLISCRVNPAIKVLWPNRT